MNRCPHLGLEDDKDTCMSIATASHMCYKISKPKSIPTDHQLSYCLHDEHLRCPVLLNGEKMFPLVNQKPFLATLISKTSVKWASIIVLVIVLVGSFYWVATNTNLFTRPDPPVHASDELPPGITPTVTRANEEEKPQITLVFDLTPQPDPPEMRGTSEANQPSP